MISEAGAPLVIWRFIDGKPGHENQSAGLVEALGRRVPVLVDEVAVSRWRSGFKRPVRMAPPTLLVGAGRHTHAAMLRARTRHGGRAVVLMRPRRAADFDLCLIPAHDAPRPAPNVLVTDGAVNRVRPAATKDEDSGLVLIGGPSRHYDWLDREVLAQVTRIVAADPARNWTLCDSRRTPVRTGALLREALPNVPFVHFADVPTDWLAERLGRAPVVWASEDSVSMVYEGLSAGAAVGLLAVPRRRRSRVAEGVAGLIARGMVTPYLMWARTGKLPPPHAPLAEADRAADWIVEQWLNRL